MSENKNLQTWSMALPIGSLDAYITQVNRVPLLSAEEEHDLASRFYYQQDLTAARQLVMTHLRFVARIARGYAGYGLAQEDLIQEGNIGLMKAVKRFNPDLGVRLVSFAVHWIKAEIHEFILKNWRIVKVATTKAQRKLFFNLRKAAKSLSWFTEEEVHAVAEDLKVSPSDVRLMETRMRGQDESFDAYFDDGDDEKTFSPAQYLEDHRYNPARLLESKDWSDQRENQLHYVLETLDERSRDILQQRWLIEDKATLQELAEKYSVSAERIRQIEKQAMDKVKVALVSA
jgi:RNA polymerase sigma-32 factor